MRTAYVLSHGGIVRCLLMTSDISTQAALAWFRGHGYTATAMPIEDALARLYRGM